MSASALHRLLYAWLGLGLATHHAPRKTLYSDPDGFIGKRAVLALPTRALMSFRDPSEILQRSFCPTVQSRSFHQAASPTFQSPININSLVFYIQLLRSQPLSSSCLILQRLPRPHNEGYSGPPKHLSRASQASLQCTRLCLSPASGLPNLTSSKIFLASILRQHSFVVHVR